jgi:hypothetical protein
MYVKRVTIEESMCILAIVTEEIHNDKVIDEVVYLIENQFREEQCKYQFFLD